MSKKLVAVAAFLVLSACRSAFAPEQVTRLSAPPAAQLAATVAAPTQLRGGPSADAQALVAVEAGAQVQVSSEVVHGYRRAKLADGRTGYLAADAVKTDATATTAQPASGNTPVAQ